MMLRRSRHAVLHAVRVCRSSTSTSSFRQIDLLSPPPGSSRSWRPYSLLYGHPSSSSAIKGDGLDSLSSPWAEKFSARYSQDAKNGAKELPEKEEVPPQQKEAETTEEASEKEKGAEDPRDLEIAELKERVLRAYADMENLMGRMKRENESVRQFAIQGFAKALLEVADNLERAGEVAAAVFKEPAQANEVPSPEAFKQHLKSLLDGVQATERQLLKVFKTHGLEKLDPQGQSFDPNLHEAMFEVEDSSKEPGLVVHVLKRGYTLNGRVLRAAEVGVTKKIVDG